LLLLLLLLLLRSFFGFDVFAFSIVAFASDAVVASIAFAISP